MPVTSPTCIRIGILRGAPSPRAALIALLAPRLAPSSRGRGRARRPSGAAPGGWCCDVVVGMTAREPAQTRPRPDLPLEEPPRALRSEFRPRRPPCRR
ncbi:hypothetical protein NDU88_001898 [Pleurodeles waltl]|uniref:Uncharacterized protein n=1 Tax=Pleurodeles waltl TaxID=8319 RepID=A0AAV7MLS6_PLEWA|nr:hypothetical protein NDU88_001898 [Pleurodeles waltl]